jgi:hypothetical protein
MHRYFGFPSEAYELLPVRYVKDYMDLYSFAGDDQQAIRMLLSTKSNHWRYEREYRLIVNGHVDIAAELGILSDTLVSIVYLSCNWRPDELMNIVRTVKAQYPYTQIRMLRRSPEKFKMVIREQFDDHLSILLS